MVWSLSKSSVAEPPPQLGDDASGDALLECVVQEMIAGRTRAEFVNELVKRRWQKAAAIKFCQLASDIAREARQSPDQRAACAARGSEKMQAAYGWIFSGLIMGAILYVSSITTRQYAVWALLAVGYGLIEMISGLTLWWPHKDFLPPAESASAPRSAPPAFKSK